MLASGSSRDLGLVVNKLHVNAVHVGGIHVCEGCTGNDNIRVDGEDDGSVASGQVGGIRHGVVVRAVVVRKKWHTRKRLVVAGSSVNLGQHHGVNVVDGSTRRCRRAEGLHQRPCATSDGWLRSGTVGSLETTRLNRLLVRVELIEEYETHLRLF